MRWITLCCLLLTGCYTHAVEPAAEPVIEADVAPIHSGQSKMPSQFINKQVRDLKAGEEGFIYTNYIRVDVHHYVWIDLDAAMTDVSKTIFTKIKVTKLEDGYGITLPHDCDEKWTTTRTGKDYARMDYCPVMKLTIGAETNE